MVRSAIGIPKEVAYPEYFDLISAHFARSDPQGILHQGRHGRAFRPFWEHLTVHPTVVENLETPERGKKSVPMNTPVRESFTQRSSAAFLPTGERRGLSASVDWVLSRKPLKWRPALVAERTSTRRQCMVTPNPTDDFNDFLRLLQRGTRRL